MTDQQTSKPIRPRLAPVTIDPIAGAAYGLSGAMPPGTIIVLTDGVVARVREDGGIDEVGAHARKSLAADPTAGRLP